MFSSTSQYNYCTWFVLFNIASDFVDTPVMAIIQPGGTSAIVCIRIMDDSVVERDEKFDVVLQTQGNGVTVGNPGQTEVVIVDDDGGFMFD